MYYQFNGSKYRAKKSNYGDYIYDSKKEAAYAQELDLRVKAKDIKSWERQIPIEIVVNGYKICKTKVDFLIHHNDDSKELVEIKGFETPDYRIKKRLIEAVFIHDNPEYIYTVVK